MNTPTQAPTDAPAPLSKILIDPRKVRAARAALGWTQLDLSDYSGVSHGSIVMYEKSQRSMMRQNLRAVQRALESAGVRFTSTYGGVAGIEWQDKVRDKLPTTTTTTTTTQTTHPEGVLTND